MQDSLLVKINEIKELEKTVEDLNSELMRAKIRLAQEKEKTDDLESEIEILNAKSKVNSKSFLFFLPELLTIQKSDEILI